MKRAFADGMGLPASPGILYRAEASSYGSRRFRYTSRHSLACNSSPHGRILTGRHSIISPAHFNMPIGYGVSGSH